MKVIHEGTPKPKYRWLGQWRSLECGTIIELDETDVKTVKDGYRSEQIDGEWLEHYCPVCDMSHAWRRSNGTFG